MNALLDEHLAADSGRILVTRNARHFARSHAGLLIVWSRDTDELGTLVDEIAAALAAVGDQDAGANLTRAL